MFFCFDEPRFGLFDIGRIVAGTARDDRILTRIGQHHEFMGPVPADRAGVGLDGTELETAALKDPAIRLIHLFVGDISTLFVSVEGVGILHDELAAAHHAETGPDFVAELGLDLVEIERHLPVAAHFPADDVRHDLFVRRSEAELVVLAVLDAEQLFAVLPPATRFLPEFGRGHHRHKDLDRSGPVHLFADDSFDLANRFQPERQVIVDSGSDLPDHSGTEHQLVRNDFGISRSFLNCRYKVLTVTHCITSFNIYIHSSTQLLFVSFAAFNTSSTSASARSASGTLRTISPWLNNSPSPLPPAILKSASRASPGPFTTQPMTATVKGASTPRRRCSTSSATRIRFIWHLPQVGQETKFTPCCRKLSDFRISKPTL